MRRAVVLTIAITLVAGMARADGGKEPLEVIPAKGLLCWKGLPLPELEGAPIGGSPLATLIDAGTRIAGSPLKPTEQITLRILETLGIIFHYPFAVSLIDATAKEISPERHGARLDKLRLVIAVKTNGKSEPFRRIIQKAVNEQTDAGIAHLEVKHAEKWKYQELSDERLPDWCVVAWGEMDGLFVMTLGVDVWPQIAAVAAGKQPSLAADPWITAVRSQQKTEPLIEVFVSARDIRKRLDPFVQGRATAFFKSWHAEDSDMAHWALGFEDRALFCVVNHRQGNGTQRRVYAHPKFATAQLKQAIPDESRYAVYRIDMEDFLPQLIGSYYATQDDEARQAAEKIWNDIQTKLGVDAERDALAHLGKNIVLHNYPEHPLHLPLAFTALIEIKSEPDKVRNTLETLCNSWQEECDELAAESGFINTGALTRDDDGVWYIQFPFFNGLAWTFTDRYIITSWSPWALRQYLDKAGDAVGKRDYLRKQ